MCVFTFQRRFKTTPLAITRPLLNHLRLLWTIYIGVTTINAIAKNCPNNFSAAYKVETVLNQVLMQRLCEQPTLGKKLAQSRLMLKLYASRVVI